MFHCGKKVISDAVFLKCIFIVSVVSSSESENWQDFSKDSLEGASRLLSVLGENIVWSLTCGIHHAHEMHN